MSALRSPRPPSGSAAQALAELMVREGLLDRAALPRLLQQHAQRGGWLGGTAVALKLVDAEALANALARVYRCPRVALSRFPPSAEARSMLDARVCAELRLVPLARRESGEVLVVAAADPGDREGLSRAAALAGCTVRAVVATEAEIVAALAQGEPQSMELESLAESLLPTEPAANDAVGFTPASLPAAPPERPRISELEALAERLVAAEAELRRTQQLVRLLGELCLESGLISREELAARVNRLKG